MIRLPYQNPLPPHPNPHQRHRAPFIVGLPLEVPVQPHSPKARCREHRREVAVGDDDQFLLRAIPPVEHRPKTYSSLILKVVRPLKSHPGLIDQREVAEVVALALREVPREVHHLDYQLAAGAQPTMRLA